jgi:hypothetical protein
MNPRQRIWEKLSITNISANSKPQLSKVAASHGRLNAKGNSPSSLTGVSTQFDDQGPRRTPERTRQLKSVSAVLQNSRAHLDNAADLGNWNDRQYR